MAVFMLHVRWHAIHRYRLKTSLLCMNECLFSTSLGSMNGWAPLWNRIIIYHDQMRPIPGIRSITHSILIAIINNSKRQTMCSRLRCTPCLECVSLPATFGLIYWYDMCKRTRSSSSTFCHANSPILTARKMKVISSWVCTPARLRSSRLVEHFMFSFSLFIINIISNLHFFHAAISLSSNHNRANDALEIKYMNYY